MLQVTDVRQTRVFKDAHAEGRGEGREEGRERERVNVARKLLEQGLSVAAIADATGLTQAQIRKLDKKPRK